MKAEEIIFLVFIVFMALSLPIGIMINNYEDKKEKEAQLRKWQEKKNKQ